MTKIRFPTSSFELTSTIYVRSIPVWNALYVVSASGITLSKEKIKERRTHSLAAKFQNTHSLFLEEG